MQAIKTLLSLLLLTGLAPVAQAQTAPTPAPAPATRVCAAVSGSVTGNGKPLAGVTVSVPGTRLLTITNGEGFFTLTLDNVAHARLDFSAAGYEPQSLPLASCAPVTVDLALLPGTRIKQRGKRKGFIIKTGPEASAVQ
ncbi:MAG: carboxypeptidase-like regulatory domain-containing protein [Hymenobacter sp.]|nr:MAG: carboxypeptidase-like regulatory domain-containing protein [Hymenobacter sp.]